MGALGQEDFWNYQTPPEREREKVARHTAALANQGGGYLVFGFRDDESVAPNRPTDLSGYSRDTFGRIVTRYLTPTFQCDVRLVQSSAGQGEWRSR